MEMITKRYRWYRDTPERPFKYSPDSIWLINPETKEWMLELRKSGKLWYNYKTPESFSKYLNMEVSDFQSFIKIWVEDALERGAVSTVGVPARRLAQVEDALERGAVSTDCNLMKINHLVEDALERGVVSTVDSRPAKRLAVEDVLKNGKQLK